ncbi:MAG: hypothetical protein CMN57_05385 [Gammaproteobacteria bacterium]|nr:hypothetical protein [Gammaproteobacteria bacterium]
MDVSRLPVIAHGAGLPTPAGGHAQRSRGPEPVIEAAAVRRPRDAAEQVIQGELLERSRGERRYSPTSDFLRARQYEGGDDTDTGMRSGAGGGFAGRQAVGAYLAHTRELIQPDINRGTAVDYFI